MKSLIQIFLIVFLIMFGSACATGTVAEDNPPPNEKEEADAGNEDDDEIESEDSIDEMGIDEIEEDHNNEAMNVLDGINVNDLFSMTLGDVIGLLGPNHSEPYFSTGSTNIEYPASCIISYLGGIGIDKEPQIELDGIIMAVTIFQEVDVYKGICVGKTLDQINSNPDLLNKLEAKTVDYDGFHISARGIYRYNDIFINTWIEFDEDLVCKEIFLKLENEYDSSSLEL